MKNTFSFRTILVSGVALGLAGAGSIAAAATSTANLAVTASVIGNCVIDAAGGIAFGNYAPAADSTSTGILTVTCTDGTVATVTLGQGVNDASGTAAAPQHRLASGANMLAYNLYQDAGNSIVWGNTPLTGESQTFSGIDGTELTVYGVIPAGQNVPVGDYVDTVIATVTF